MSVTIAEPAEGRFVSRFQQVAPLLIALPIGCFILFVVTYAVNVPWFDDIDAFLGFILAYTDSTTLAGKIDNILVPNNEHRIVVAKLITLAMYYLTGEVNFRWLILIALLFILATVALLFRVFKSVKSALWLFAPVPFLMLQPQYFLTSLWSIPGLQHPVVIALTLSALYMLTQSGRKTFVCAIVLLELATLSMSNGLMGWVAGGIILALHRSWYKLAAWLASSLVAIFLYFHNFQSAGRTGESLAYSFSHPVQAAAAFFTFTGGLFNLTPGADDSWRYVLPTIAGFLLTALILLLLYRMNRAAWSVKPTGVTTALTQRRLFFTGAYIFFYGNAAIIALLRLRYGYDVMVVSNYMIYPAVLFALVYLNVLSENPNRRIQGLIFRVGFIASLLVWLLAYWFYWPKMALRKQMLLTSAMNQKHAGIGLGATWGTPFADMARRVMNESVKRGIYQYPVSYLSPVEPMLYATDSSMNKDSCQTIAIEGEGVIYQAKSAANAYENIHGQAAVLVKSGQNVMLYTSVTPFMWRHFWLNRPVTAVQAELLTIALKPGTYQIGLVTPSNPDRPIRSTCQSITVP